MALQILKQTIKKQVATKVYITNVRQPVNIT